MSLELNEVSGKNVWVAFPSETTSQLTVGADGILRVYVNMNGVYVVDTSNISGRDTTITLTVKV